MTRILQALLIMVALCTGCVAAAGGEDGPDGPGGPGDDGTEIPGGGEYQFAFAPYAVEEYTVKTDHLGFALISTVALNRSDEANCRGASNLGGLLDLARGMVRINRMWKDDLQALGYTTCSMDHPDGLSPTLENAADFLASTPCTTQRVWRTLPNGERVGGDRLVDLITPDFATVHLDDPAGFPNGREPHDQITDLVLASGLIAISEEMTLDLVTLNPPENDVPFPEGFPYLAPRHTTPPWAGEPDGVVP